MDNFDYKDIFLKKDKEIIGLHAVGHHELHIITVVGLDGERFEIETDFMELEKWGNEYDENLKMIGKGSFRVFSLTLEHAAEEMELDGWVRFEPKSKTKDMKKLPLIKRTNQYDALIVLPLFFGLTLLGLYCIHLLNGALK